VLVCLLGCGKKANLYIYGGPERYEYEDGDVYGGTYGYLLCDPILDTMSVKLNGKTIEVETDFGDDIEYWFEDTITPSPNNEYKLEVETNVGDANATCRVPGAFSITSPGDSISTGSLTVSWSEATEADWYHVCLYLWWYDTTYHYKDTSLYTTEKSVTISNWLDHNGYLDIDVYAGDGPKIEAGSKGNISGAKGFWIGTNGRNKDVVVGSPAKMKVPEPKPKTQKEIIKGYLNWIAPSNEEAAEILEMMD
jgi:hypothetical protein